MKKLALLNYNIYIEKNINKNLDNYLDPSKRKVIITDQNIFKLGLVDNLVVSNILDIIIVEAGEESKSFKVVSQILSRLIELNVNRNDLIVAYGGGVIGDLSGFVANIYMRGLSYVQIPTTLLAMVDSSIGGKTALNFEGYKNIVGSFYQPVAVFVDVECLETLDNRQLNNGIAEVIKAGIIANDYILTMLESNYDIEELIYSALIVKKEIVESDQFERGNRKLLNYGHTIGHAIESYYNFEKYLHGEAVAIGMLFMINNKNDQLRLIKLLKKYQLYQVEKVEKIFEYIKYDKKVVNSNLIDIVIASKIGSVMIKQMSFEELYQYIKENSYE